MTAGLHVANNKAFSDRMKPVTSCFADKNCEARSSTEIATKADHLSNFIPYSLNLLLEPP